ncbi:MAG: hypothetical protein R3B99_31195 [Polyangiales bacterium]
MLALFLTVMGTYGVFRGIRELTGDRLGAMPELLDAEEQARVEALAELPGDLLQRAEPPTPRRPPTSCSPRC